MHTPLVGQALVFRCSGTDCMVFFMVLFVVLSSVSTTTCVLASHARCTVLGDNKPHQLHVLLIVTLSQSPHILGMYFIICKVRPDQS